MRTLPRPLPRLAALLAPLLGAALLGCDSTPIGLACLNVQDCMASTPLQTCYHQPGTNAGVKPDGGIQFGFCSRACDEEGSSGGCPGGSVCAANGESLVCVPTCTTDSSCPTAGLVCSPVGDQRGCVFPPL